MATAFFRTIILYLLLIAGLRLSGKRQIGELEPIELVLTPCPRCSAPSACAACASAVWCAASPPWSSPPASSGRRPCAAIA